MNLGSEGGKKTKKEKDGGEWKQKGVRAWGQAAQRAQSLDWCE